MNKNTQWVIKASLLSCTLTAVVTFSALYFRPASIDSQYSAEDKAFTLAEIKNYDGTIDNKPIYVAMNGLVYDVSAGREYYVSGGPYHYLAGKDSSKELNLFGGAIIKKKYPVIGKIIKP